MTEINPLFMGKIAVVDNSVPGSIRIYPNGQYLVDNNFVVLEEGTPGNYLFDGLPASTNIQLSVQTAGSDMQYAVQTSSAVFQLDPFLEQSSQTTNEQGELTIKLGATLTSSGDGIYLDGVYFKPITLQLDY